MEQKLQKDYDGVEDDWDDCPGTASGAEVDAWGCSDAQNNGGGGGNGGGFRRGPTPPNIDEIVKNIQDKINKILPGGAKGGNKPIFLGLIILVIIWALSGLYRVLPDEQGVVLRFGKFVSTTQPGLNYHIPFPVESALTPKVTKVNRIDIGFVYKGSLS